MNNKLNTESLIGKFLHWKLKENIDKETIVEQIMLIEQIQKTDNAKYNMEIRGYNLTLNKETHFLFTENEITLLVNDKEVYLNFNSHWNFFIL